MQDDDSGYTNENKQIINLILYPESTLHLVLRLRGGGKKKRKKKVYSTQKKKPRKHKKVRMAILKYYEVDEEGNIKRLRSECTSETCGAAVFMAKHVKGVARQ